MPVTTYVSTSVYANVIAKTGRNEVQIGEVATDGKLSAPLARHELGGDEIVVDGVWVPIDLAQASGKKRKAGSQANGEAKPVIVFCGLFSSGQVRIFSTSTVVPVATDKLVAIAAGKNTFWGASEESFTEYNVNGATENVIQMAGVSKAVSLDAWKKKMNEVFSLITEGDRITVIQPSRKSAVATFSLDFSPSKAVQSSRVKTTLVFANDSTVEARDFDSHNFCTFDLASHGTVTALQTVLDPETNNEYVFVGTDSGVAVYLLDLSSSASSVAPKALLTTDIAIDAIYHINNKVFAVYHQGIDAVSVLLPWTINTIGTVTVSLPSVSTEVTPLRSDKPLLSLANGKVEPTADVSSASELHSRLLSALKNNTDEAVAVCATIDNDVVVKDTVKLFHQDAPILFTAVANEVSTDPSKSSSLSLWLKWLLLIHGGALAKDPTTAPVVVNLHSSLGDGMKVLSHLLALQGRLQLLKSQGWLRKHGDLEDSEVEAVREDGLVYANGENDE